MQVYVAESYINSNKEDSENAFLILNDQERSHLVSCYEDLIKKLNAKTKKGTLKKWNKYDVQVLDFIRTLFHYRDGGQMLDISIKQTHFIDKTLKKIYTGANRDFCIWAKLEGLDDDDISIMTKKESFDNMEYKRRKEREWQGKSTIADLEFDD